MFKNGFSSITLRRKALVTLAWLFPVDADYVLPSFPSIAIMERGRTGLTPKPTARLGSSSFELLVAVGGDIPSTFRGTFGSQTTGWPITASETIMLLAFTLTHQCHFNTRN